MSREGVNARPFMLELVIASVEREMESCDGASQFPDLFNIVSFINRCPWKHRHETPSPLRCSIIRAFDGPFAIRSLAKHGDCDGMLAKNRCECGDIVVDGWPKNRVDALKHPDIVDIPGFIDEATGHLDTRLRFRLVESEFDEFFNRCIGIIE